MSSGSFNSFKSKAIYKLFAYKPYKYVRTRVWGGL